MLESTPFSSDFDSEELPPKDVDSTLGGSTHLGGFKAVWASQKGNLHLLISVLANAMMAFALAFLLLSKPQADDYKYCSSQKASNPPGKSVRLIVPMSQSSGLLIRSCDISFSRC
jgi:hypothetical protein